MERTTRDLILSLQGGQLDSLGELYDRYHQLVYRTALAIAGDKETASDLLQDVFLRLHRFAHKVDPERPLEPWLYRMTANLSITRVKKRRWFKPVEEIADWFAGETKHSPAHFAEKSDEWREVEEAIQHLPLGQRTVIVMYYINELSLKEISEVLDLPVGTLKSRLYYGRQALKKHLDMQHGTLPEVRYEFT